MTAVMTVKPTHDGREHGAWCARCRLCPTWTPDCYRTELGARHYAAVHLWENHVAAAAPPRLCPVSGKRRHPTRNAAREQIRSLYRAGRGNPDYRPYVCADCRGWHIGHSQHSLTRRIRKATRS